VPTKLNITAPSRDTFYRLEEYADLAAGSILVKTPITLEGDRDLLCVTLYRGVTFVNGGQIRVEFDLDGPSLADAINSWTPLCRKAIEEVQSQIFKSAILSPDGKPIKPQA
jgi:hypothetical protein